jgi:hypothetical protein
MDISGKLQDLLTANETLVMPDAYDPANNQHP